MTDERSTLNMSSPGDRRSPRRASSFSCRATREERFDPVAAWPDLLPAPAVHDRLLLRQVVLEVFELAQDLVR